MLAIHKLFSGNGNCTQSKLTKSKYDQTSETKIEEHKMEGGIIKVTLTGDFMLIFVFMLQVD